MDVASARSYVEQHGTPIERARLHALLDGVMPPDVPPELAALQNPDGGFPFQLQANNPSSLHHSVLVLDWLHDLQQNQSAIAEGAYAFLLSRQLRRGLWRESQELLRFDLPLWMEPDSAAGDVYTTALCAARLVAHPRAELALDRAAAWMQTQQARDGLLPGFKLYASSLAAPVFAHALGLDARPTRRLVAGLGESFGPDWTAPLLANLLRRLLEAGYHLRTAVVARAWTLLQELQEPDGSFLPGDEPESATTTTLSVLAVARQMEDEQASRVR